MGKNILFYIHGGNVNRGCEAIITSTSKLIKDCIKDSNITVSTQYYDSDIKRKIENIDKFIASESVPKKISCERIYRMFLRKFNLKNQNIKRVYKDTINEIRNSDISFVIGGDTYFKDYGMLDTLYILNDEVRNSKKKNILWCCSIEEKEIDEYMKEDLSKFDLIVARESITKNNLYKKGIKDNVKLYPDPAFTMEVKEVDLPTGWVDGNTIVINTSPLITKFEKKSNLFIESIKELINYILRNTIYTVAFLPHVDCDEITNKTIYESFKDNKRVININFGYSARELKYIISKSELVIATRTHASIAAYSKCVPTLVIGYSVKSLGIARDIFGSEKDMVIPVNTIENKNTLITAFKKLYKNKEKIKKQLETVMPKYIDKSFELQEEIKKQLSY